ncbi:MAG: class I SAM-dependent methyltransferase, partial [Methylococcaceae bacterium]|nr:class I SAM-dependent methyltransferase [Methylococcaceae bacterium]
AVEDQAVKFKDQLEQRLSEIIEQTDTRANLLQQKVAESGYRATEIESLFEQKISDVMNSYTYFKKLIEKELDESSSQLIDLKRNVLDQHRRLALLLEEARKCLPEKMPMDQIQSMVSEEEHLLDAFYVAFENRFRGTREDIENRSEVYLPIVQEANAGSAEAPILDIGCGRGEWVELLKENNLVAQGIDLNRAMVRQCQELDLDVIEADALAYLCGLKEDSLGAVTGMHIIEHIPFKKLIGICDEVLRVLKPGGVAIFETPNPENLIVGACSFYSDPSHIKPLPPEPIRFLMESRGFSNIRIVRLHPRLESINIVDDNSQLPQILKNCLFGAQDYSVVAYKA